MKITDYNLKDLRVLLANEQTSEYPLTSFVPKGYTVIVPVVINPINKQPYSHGYIIRHDGVFKLSTDIFTAYAEKNTSPETYKLLGNKWTDINDKNNIVEEYECFFTPVFPAGFVGERDTLPLSVINKIEKKLKNLGFFPKFYPVLHASEEITENYRKQMLEDLRSFRRQIPPGVALLLRIKAPHSIIIMMSEDNISYTSDSLKVKDFALGLPETEVLSSLPYIWIGDKVINTDVLPCIIPTVLEENTDFERILSKDILLLHEIHFFLSKFKGVPTLLDMRKELSLSQIRYLVEHLSEKYDIYIDPLISEHNQRIDKEIGELKKEIEKMKNGYIRKFLK